MPANQPFNSGAFTKNTVKTDAETLTLAIDWADTMASTDTVTASAWTGPVGVTLDDLGYVGSLASAQVSGGTAGQIYTVTNTADITDADANVEIVQTEIQIYVME